MTSSLSYHQNCPESFVVTLLSLDLDKTKANLCDFIQIRFRKELQKIELSKEENKSSVCFALDCHKLLFDSIKIYVYEKSLVNQYKRIGKVLIRLASLDHFDNEFTQSFLIHSDSKHCHRQRHFIIGTIQLRFSFPLFSDQLLDAKVSQISNSSTFVNEPEFMDAMSEFPLGELPSTPTSALPSALPSAFNGLLTPPSTPTLMQHPSIVNMRSDSISSTSSSNSSVRTLYSTSSSLQYGFLSEHTFMGFKEFSELKAAFLGTGWKMSKFQLFKAYSLLSKYYHDVYRHCHTNDVVTDTKLLEIAGYFVHFALVSYGALLLNYFGFGSLKNLFHMTPNKKSAMEHLHIPKEHILAWEFGSFELFRPNFFVCYDQRTKSIVLTIRGTLNLHECLVDAICDYTPFQGGLVHKGFLRSAFWLYDHVLPNLKKWMHEFKTNSLYIVGHSMGAGAASLFRMMLAEEDSFQCNIKTVCFATTATASLDLCQKYKSEILTFINERDMVPRISYGSVQDFQELLKLAANLLKSPINTQEKLQEISKRHAALKESKVHLKLYPPGTIYNLYKTSRSGMEQQQEPHYVCEESHWEAFSDVRFGTNALFDHFLDKYDNSLRKAHAWLKKQNL